MAKVADTLGPGYHASTVSNMEKGKRAVKEHTLDRWAKALGVRVFDLRRAWNVADMMEAPPITRKLHAKSVRVLTLEEKIRKLNSIERSKVQGYIDALIESRQHS